MDSVVASLLLVAFFSPPHLRRGAGAAGGVVCHRVEPPRRFAPPLLVQGGDCRLMNRSHVFNSSAPRPCLRACRAPSSRSPRHRRGGAPPPSRPFLRATAA